MFPTLIDFPASWPLIGGKSLHSYGALVALGFLLGLLWVRRESERVGLSAQKMMDLFTYIILAAIVGSRLLYVFISVPDWWTHPWVLFQIWEGGLVFYGGLIGAVLISIWYTRKHQMPFFAVADVFIPGVALGHAIGRLGCFAAGCCYGRPIDPSSPFAVWFPETPHSIAPTTHPVYPTQLFEAAGELVIFGVLFLFRKKKKFEGEVFLLYIILYPILRSVLETFRGDAVRGFIVEGVLSTSQFISILWVVVALLVWQFQLRREKK